MEVIGGTSKSMSRTFNTASLAANLPAKLLARVGSSPVDDSISCDVNNLRV